MPHCKRCRRTKCQCAKNLLALRDRIKAKLAAERERRAVPSGPTPRYDDVYFRGMAWLDELARS